MRTFCVHVPVLRLHGCAHAPVCNTLAEDNVQSAEIKVEAAKESTRQVRLIALHISIELAFKGLSMKDSLVFSDDNRIIGGGLCECEENSW